jgi:hypothetical protein
MKTNASVHWQKIAVNEKRTTERRKSQVCRLLKSDLFYSLSAVLCYISALKHISIHNFPLVCVCVCVWGGVIVVKIEASLLIFHSSAYTSDLLPICVSVP